MGVMFGGFLFVFLWAHVRELWVDLVVDGWMEWVNGWFVGLMLAMAVEQTMAHREYWVLMRKGEGKGRRE